MNAAFEVLHWFVEADYHQKEKCFTIQELWVASKRRALAGWQSSRRRYRSSSGEIFGLKIPLETHLSTSRSACTTRISLEEAGWTWSAAIMSSTSLSMILSLTLEWERDFSRQGITAALSKVYQETSIWLFGFGEIGFGDQMVVKKKDDNMNASKRGLISKVWCSEAKMGSVVCRDV